LEGVLKCGIFRLFIPKRHLVMAAIQAEVICQANIADFAGTRKSQYFPPLT
jgi:hypothetical protein